MTRQPARSAALATAPVPVPTSSSRALFPAGSSETRSRAGAAKYTCSAFDAYSSLTSS